MATAPARLLPGQVHQLAVDAVKELNVDIDSSRSKNVSKFSEVHFDVVIMVCGDANEEKQRSRHRQVVLGLRRPQEVEQYQQIPRSARPDGADIQTGSTAA